MTFMLVPCAAAVLVGWIARHWALAGAALTGGIGLFLLVAPMGTTLSRLVLPFGTGAAIAGLAMIIVLKARPSTSVWSRMTIALTATFFPHFLFISYAMAGR
ncbi:hypothetical protein SAMN05444287_3094 [Octadecabacter temperatus]|uniref:Uncharacterized protein n=1 Tax=Octadecabacter temperatus TaxID=1458307 RepID=A0A0K0Y8Q3_9RHOB|nr:hypothetical protein [Octadecabacter temperatus]AKS47266.1 hypothetical protein OSB_27420 [Octadecabacter temperatus]SIO44637.1 hypothetical protein SAMN05444287_3094 [Octadecabacter temperatus]